MPTNFKSRTTSIIRRKIAPMQSQGLFDLLANGKNRI